ncbi:MAG TPA: hypothetical protein P5026_07765 [Kiritimatiellia bacterium]|nr:hypothetical protein [Kiritimatiellia bacterium]HRU70187.1 hypothetical protein [Kiritimatiellia bacterium]
MGKELKRMARNFARGAASFAAFPFAAPPRAQTRPARRPPPAPDVARYFGAAGGYISRACGKAGAGSRAR